MFSFRRSVLLLALTVSASLGAQAQSSSSQPAQPDAPPAAAAQTKGPLTVQARLKARREQRRATAIHDVYSHLYEVYVGTGYLRTHAGPDLQRVNEYSWDLGVTRYYSERFGVTIDGRGLYGSPFVGLNGSPINKPAISQYMGMIGPTYRFLLNPKYSVSGRVMGGASYGNFSGDLGSFTPAEVGLYSNGPSVVISASVPVEYNLSPEIGLRIAPEYVLTNFGSTIQNSLGFTGGVVVRWGKQ